MYVAFTYMFDNISISLRWNWSLQSIDSSLNLHLPGLVYHLQGPLGDRNDVPVAVVTPIVWWLTRVKKAQVTCL